jgi:hypothetical protein
MLCSWIITTSNFLGWFNKDIVRFKGFLEDILHPSQLINNSTASCTPFNNNSYAWLTLEMEGCALICIPIFWIQEYQTVQMCQLVLVATLALSWIPRSPWSIPPWLKASLHAQLCSLHCVTPSWSLRVMVAWSWYTHTHFWKLPRGLQRPFISWD